MKNNLIVGFLGLGITLANFLGLASGVKAAVIMAMGIAVGFISFREVVRRKVAKAVSEKNTQPEKPPASGDNKNLIQ